MTERLDRIEAILERLAERQDRTQQQLDQFQGEVRAFVQEAAEDITGLMASLANDLDALGSQVNAYIAQSNANLAAERLGRAEFRRQMIGLQTETRNILRELADMRQQQVFPPVVTDPKPTNTSPIVTNSRSPATPPLNTSICWNIYSPEESKRLWRGRSPLGRIEIVNDSDQFVEVKLFHPDGDEKVFASWSVDPEQSMFLTMDGQPITIGADWGIQISSSCIMPVGNAGQYSEGRYRVSSSFLVY